MGQIFKIEGKTTNLFKYTIKIYVNDLFRSNFFFVLLLFLVIKPSYFEKKTVKKFELKYVKTFSNIPYT